jgi:hypothetical protein
MLADFPRANTKLSPAQQSAPTAGGFGHARVLRLYSLPLVPSPFPLPPATCPFPPAPLTDFLSFMLIPISQPHATFDLPHTMPNVALQC